MLEQIDPYGERRDDYRFALLALTVAKAAGAKKDDGQALTVRDFLVRFDAPVTQAGDAGPAGDAAPPRQTVRDMERRLTAWMSGSNAIFREGTKR